MAEEVKEQAVVKDTKTVSKDLEDLIKKVETMSVLELSQLVKALENKFGVSAAAPVAVAAVGAPGAGAAAGGAEEKTEFDVVLTSSGDKKIQVIKELRTLTNLGLKEAKDLVDGAPKTVKANATKEEANEIKTKLEAAGGKVEIK
jgi:large subunit ribosomal protein L7/L12